ncbi:hypothetical protein KUCAC02_010812 [Chaenocephalus aceratus]|uniref:Uncharacterized protein n=1 Tax=Chaenocephalus aceratus TaxID=36190 RepID=A0ACB9WTV3_CHAAC|nr:hypothetical protein KUCAC02_010812 [Chaenocephalus aceratus]
MQVCRGFKLRCTDPVQVDCFVSNSKQNSSLMRQPANANSWESNPRLELSRELEETRRELAREKNLTKRFLKEEQETRRKLEEAKQKLARQTNLKEMSITKEKDIQDEFESLKRTCDLESMHNFEIATEVRNNMKRTMKKELHQEFEQVKVAYRSNQEYFYQTIQFEKRNQAAFQQELEQLRGWRQNNPLVLGLVGSGF